MGILSNVRKGVGVAKNGGVFFGDEWPGRPGLSESVQKSFFSKKAGTLLQGQHTLSCNNNLILYT
jgi:hypothetical protein